MQVVREETGLRGVFRGSAFARKRELFGLHGKEYAQLQGQLKEIEAKLIAWHQADGCSQRAAQIIGASMLVMKTPAAEGIPVSTALCGLARLDTKGSFDGRKGEARRYCARRR